MKPELKSWIGYVVAQWSKRLPRDLNEAPVRLQPKDIDVNYKTFSRQAIRKKKIVYLRKKLARQ